MAGNTVRCPRCQTQFVFAPIKPSRSQPMTRQSPTPAVMRILGDAEGSAASPEVKPRSNERSSVSETGVMRILGDAEALPPRPENSVLTHQCRAFDAGTPFLSVLASA